MADMGWSRYIADWEAAEAGKCFEAAEKHGMTPLQAEDCDDGDKGCPECPWKDLPNYVVKKEEEK
jgi:hypothetical protein